MMLLTFLTVLGFIRLLYYWWIKKIWYFSGWIMESNFAILNTLFFLNGGTTEILVPISSVAHFDPRQKQEAHCIQTGDDVALIECSPVGNQSSFVNTLTETSEPDCQTGCDHNSDKEPVMSSLLYQALFSTGDSSQVQGNETTYDVRQQQIESLNWSSQNYSQSSEADSKEWSSFSDISNAISPAASNDSIEAGLKASRPKPELLDDRESAETNNFEAAPSELTPLEDHFGPASAGSLASPVVGLEDEKLNHYPVTEDSSDLEFRNGENEDHSASSPVQYCVAQLPLTELLPAEQQQGVCQTLNTECYLAAINEETKKDLKGKLLSKMKQIKEDRRCQHSYSRVLKQHHDQQHQYQQQQQQQSQCNLKEQQSPCTQSLSSTTTFITSSVHCVTSSSMSVDIAPQSPGVMSSSSDKSVSSLKSTSKTYRYNQTAALLQKSGLFQATAKTAELLKKNMTLQKELQKLKRETMLFVHSVLSNPENEHLRQLYLTSHQGLS